GDVEIARSNPDLGRSRIATGEALARELDRWDLVADSILAVGGLGFSPSLADARERAAKVLEVLDHLGPRDAIRRISLWCWLAHLMVNADADLTEHALA